MKALHSKRRIVWRWAWTGTFVSLIVTAVTLGLIAYGTALPLWSETHEAGPSLVSILLTMPLAWLIALIGPSGWLQIGGLVWALQLRRCRPLILSGIGAALFALFWPSVGFGIMGF